VCEEICQRLHDQCVVMLSQDSFYRGLTPAELANVKGEEESKERARRERGARTRAPLLSRSRPLPLSPSPFFSFFLLL
jgi:hypothetical protein